MTCFHNRPAWKSTLENAKGKHAINFTFRTDRSPDYFIPCGKCEGCRARQRQDWAIRMAHESQSWDRNSFLTLTYDEEHCPEKINKHDIQTFLKRLRKHSDRKIRYYITGEYGERTRRPHYHAIIFNEDFLGGAYDISDKLYGNKWLDSIWKNGTTTIAPFSFATAMYTAGYCAKKISDPDTFALQSRNPPIGREWVKANHDNIRRNKNVVISGQEFTIPLVYMNWLRGDETFLNIKKELAENVEPKTDRQLRNQKLNHNAQQNLRNHKI